MYLLHLYINRSNVSKLVSLHLGSQPTTVLCHMGDFGCGDGGWTPVMKINGNKVPCRIDFLSIVGHYRQLERYFSTGVDWLIDNEGDFRSLLMSPADISLTKWTDTICQMGWEGGIVSNCLKTSRIVQWIVRKPVINLYHIINYSPRVPFTMILVTGVIKLNTTLLEGRLDSTHKRPSCLLTGTHPSPRSVSVWRSVNRSDSL